MSLKRKHRTHQLPRPKKATSFIVPESATPLQRIAHLLQHITVRNKNQHRSLPWFKHLNLLRRGVRQLIAYDDALRGWQLQQHGGGTTDSTKGGGASALSASTVRERFEREAEIRRQREVVEAWMREVVVPRAYVEFSRVVGDKQFAGLGVVLVGLVAEVAGVVGLPTPAARERELRGGNGRVQAGTKSVVARSVRITGVEKGLVEERVFDSPDDGDEDDLGEVVERSEAGELGQGIRDAQAGGRVEGQQMDVELLPEQAQMVTTSTERQASKKELQDAKTTKHIHNAGVARPQLKKPVKEETIKPKAKVKKKKNAIDEIFGDW